MSFKKFKNAIPCGCIFVFILIVNFQVVIAQQNSHVITIDTKNTRDTFKPIWSYFGYDEANYTTMKDGKKLLTELAALSAGPVYVRVHNLLTSGDGKAALKWSSTNAYTEDATGKPVYNWQEVDAIFDVFVQRGIKPIAEIGFMPEALSTKPQPYQHHWQPGVPYDSIYTGWAYPPTDYKKWGQLVYEWVKHCVNKYGEKEVKSWYWEVWNEPNISYWKGTMEEYFMLYDFAADAVKKASPMARVGGPATTGPRWDKAGNFLQAFLQHCLDGKNSATGKTGAPLDYITFHAKGNPTVVNNQVRMNMAVQLQDVTRGFEIINGFATLKKLPVIIGEFDPEGCAACSVQFNPQNAYRNGTMYSSYTAASFAQLYALANKYNINLRGAVSWSFEFEDQPWFAGFRDLATNGVDKPVLNVFRLFGMMKGKMLEVDNPGRLSLQQIVDSSVHGGKPYVDAIATLGTHELYVLCWNYQDDESKKSRELINLMLQNLPAGKIDIRTYLIDETHSNAYTLWKQLNSPQQVTADQFKQLEKAGKLQQDVPSKKLKVANGKAAYKFLLSGQAVQLLKISW
jgi:xylan 1,4-beta-xylosidase